MYYFIFIFRKIMKRTQKIIVTTLATTLLLATSWVNAMGDTSGTSMGSQNDQMESQREGMDSNKDEMKRERDEMKKERGEMKKEFESKKWEMKEGIQNFRDVNKSKFKETFKSLDNETKAEVKKISSEYRTKSKEIISKLRSKDFSFADKVKLREELESLREEKFNSLQEKLSNNEEANNLINSRKELFEKNRDIRNSMTEKRKEFRKNRSSMITKYKTFVIKKIWSKIDLMNEKQLSTLDNRVQKLYSKYENNTKLNQETKDKIFSILEALRDTIDEKLKMIDSENDDVLNELLWDNISE